MTELLTCRPLAMEDGMLHSIKTRFALLFSFVVMVGCSGQGPKRNLAVEPVNDLPNPYERVEPWAPSAIAAVHRFRQGIKNWRIATSAGDFH